MWARQTRPYIESALDGKKEAWLHTDIQRQQPPSSGDTGGWWYQSYKAETKVLGFFVSK